MPSYLTRLLNYFKLLLRLPLSILSRLFKLNAGEPPSEFYHARLGEVLRSKYKLRCKLGCGAYSTTYLASYQDNSEKSHFVAVKVLSRDATTECNGEHKTMLELDVMQRIRESGDFDTLPRLLDYFDIVERGLPAHTCMVMRVFGSDVAAFRRTSPTKALPHYTVRIIIKQVLDALAHLHDLGVVHTDVKPDNMLLNTWMSDDDIADWLRTLPLSGKGSENVSHPLPNAPELTYNCPPEVAKRIRVVLIDLGQAQWANQVPTVDQFSAFSLRAPEVILQSDFTTAIDIWAVGCIVFEMLVGRWLFHPVDGGDDWSLEDDHLAKMMEFTGETFNEEMRSRAGLGPKYFNDKGELLRVTDLFPVAIENALANYKIVPVEEVKPAADFIRACVRLDPADRPTARVLAEHPWFQAVNLYQT